jgi:hypothetical protein
MLHICDMLRLGRWMSCIVVTCASASWSQPLPAEPAGANEPATPADTADNDDLSAELQEAEARFATGRVNALTDPVIITRGLAATDARVRAQACHVAAWLPGDVAVAPLMSAIGDEDERVRLAAVQSLSFLVRRSEGQSRDGIRTALVARVDDASDAVACAAMEWFATDSPDQLQVLKPKADLASDIRYACYRRVLELPPRAVVIAAPAPSTPMAAPPVIEDEPAMPFSWLSLASGAVAGATIGASIPSALVPSRDVLVYTPKQSRYFRQSTSFLGQIGAALGGAVVLGGSAVALDLLVGEAPPAAQLAVALTTVAGTVAGAGSGFAVGSTTATPVGIAIGTGIGFGSGLLLSHVAPPTIRSNALAVGVGLLSGAGAALTLATVLPVNLAVVGSTDRSEFLLGTSMATMGVATMAALAAAPLVDLSVGRSVAMAMGGLAGAGLAGSVAFAAIPNIDTKSRIAAGVALGGMVAGTMGGALWPSSWLPDALADAAVAPTVAAIAAGAELVPTIGAVGVF